MNIPQRYCLLKHLRMPAQELERPPLPLCCGHVAMLLAGGVCDGYIDVGDGERALVKGTHSTDTYKVREEEVLGDNGEVIKVKEIYRTRHGLSVRVLRESGQIENYDIGRSMDIEDEQ